MPPFEKYFDFQQAVKLLTGLFGPSRLSYILCQGRFIAIQNLALEKFLTVVRHPHHCGVTFLGLNIVYTRCSARSFHYGWTGRPVSLRTTQPTVPALHNFWYHSAFSLTAGNLCWASGNLTLHVCSPALGQGSTMNDHTDF